MELAQFKLPGNGSNDTEVCKNDTFTSTIYQDNSSSFFLLLFRNELMAKSNSITQVPESLVPHLLGQL